jgi:hypothetical protein
MRSISNHIYNLHIIQLYDFKKIDVHLRPYSSHCHTTVTVYTLHRINGNAEMLCAQGVRPVWTPLRGHADQPDRPPTCVSSVAPAACLVAPTPVLRTRPTALAPPSTPPDDTDRRLKGKEKRRTLVRKPSRLTACYGYGARCRRRRPH